MTGGKINYKPLWNVLWQFVSYPLIAGTAWYWVLGIHFPFWKILVIAVIQTLSTYIGLNIARATKPEEEPK